MIIGILGHSQHGKDSIGDVLKKQFDYEKDALASPIKQCLQILFPHWTYRHLYGDLKDVIDPVTGIKPRSAMHSFGEDFVRRDLLEYDNFNSVTGKYLFVKSQEERMRGKSRVVICDVRKRIESDMVRSAGGIVIKVVRPDYPVQNLSSESEVDEANYDYLLSNNGTLVDLEYKVCDLYEKHLIFKE